MSPEFKQILYLQYASAPQNIIIQGSKLGVKTHR